MKHRGGRKLSIVAGLAMIVGIFAIQPASAIAPGTAPFQTTWQRTDQPVSDGSAARTWMWGPSGFSSSMYEPYAESPNGWRVVQYYDKSRMEITHPDAVDDGLFYVTNGLLVVELMTGQLQIGDTQFVSREPARVNVAGDADDAFGPTYAAFGQVRSVAPLPDGAPIDQRIARDGTFTDDPALAAQGVVAGHHVIVPGIDHQVAAPFWDFMNSSGLVDEGESTVEAPLFQNPFYATGYPVTEAYWATVRVAGTPRLVLIQCFERRCLTYTPGNSAGFVVEAGNVGQHYFQWRYNMPIPGEPPASPGGQNDVGASPMSEWPVDLTGQANMVIANQSPYALTVTFSGPTQVSSTIPACPSCIVYPSPQAFTGCMDSLPLQEFTLAEGNYRVTLSWAENNVPNADGPWTIVPNAYFGECWAVFQQDTTPPPPPPPACDPAYPTVCIAPPPPDLDCTDIPYTDFTVLPPDPHVFDTDGDGIGCEIEAPPPPPSATTFGDGVYQVGVDIPAGTYRNDDSSGGCYWERVTGFGGTLDEIIANDFTDDRTVVTIKPTDVGFTSDRCGTWSSDLSAITSSLTAPFSDGTYIVGTDIGPGTWRNSDSSDDCYWERLSGFDGTLNSIIANSFSDDLQIVTISPSDKGFHADRCGTWTKTN